MNSRFVYLSRTHTHILSISLSLTHTHAHTLSLSLSLSVRYLADEGAVRSGAWDVVGIPGFEKRWVRKGAVTSKPWTLLPEP